MDLLSLLASVLFDLKHTAGPNTRFKSTNDMSSMLSIYLQN